MLHLVSLSKQSKPSIRIAGLDPNDCLTHDFVFEIVEGELGTLWWMNCTSWTRGLSTRLGGEPQKYGGEHPRFDESLHPLLLRIMSKISNPALSSLCSGVWLRCHLKGFGSSEDGWLTKPSLSGFGQMTTSSSDFSLKNAALSLPISFILLFFSESQFKSAQDSLCLY